MIYKFRELLQYDKIQNFPKNIIVEGLIKSWEYDKFINQVNKINDKIICEETDYCVIVTIYRKDISENLIMKLKNIIHLSGYQVANYIINNIERGKGFPNNYIIFDNYDVLKLEINKKFDSLKNGIPVFLYHVTEQKNMIKINKNGLYPKSKNKIEYHPDRLYFFDNIESAKYYKNDLNDRNLTDDELIILKVDMRLSNNDITLYNDPKFGDSDFGAYYTYDHISPFYISEEIN